MTAGAWAGWGVEGRGGAAQTPRGLRRLRGGGAAAGRVKVDKKIRMCVSGCVCGKRARERERERWRNT